MFSRNSLVGVFSLLLPNNINDLNEDDAEISRQYMQNVSVQLQNAVLHETIHGLAVRDGLTNLFNHRYFQNALDNEILRAIRFKKSFSIILFDIDNFKHYNDTNGHPAGDRLLQEIATKIMQTSRGTDTYARYGGEEFVIILPETDKNGAAIRAEKLRSAIANHPFFNSSAQPLGCVSISGGYAEFPLDAESKTALIKLVDQALYQAKKTGRNRILPVP
jgi:diguanylate cyclase (GGDEF)-like protein